MTLSLLIVLLFLQRSNLYPLPGGPLQRSDEISTVSRDADGRADGDSNEEGNCTKVIASCIETYDDLESYILNGKNEVISQLKGAFFVPGKPPPEFVHLAYNTQVLCNSAVSCTNYTSWYIWSDRFLYLIDPRPLFWLTLFAVSVSEHSATIDLTKLCLCGDVYDSLLSQLTNMVCAYFYCSEH